MFGTQASKSFGISLQYIPNNLGPTNVNLERAIGCDFMISACVSVVLGMGGGSAWHDLPIRTLGRFSSRGVLQQKTLGSAERWANVLESLLPNHVNWAMMTPGVHTKNWAIFHSQELLNPAPEKWPRAPRGKDRLPVPPFFRGYLKLRGCDLRRNPESQPPFLLSRWCHVTVMGGTISTQMTMGWFQPHHAKKVSKEVLLLFTAKQQQKRCK